LIFKSLVSAGLGWVRLPSDAFRDLFGIGFPWMPPFRSPAERHRVPEPPPAPAYYSTRAGSSSPPGAALRRDGSNQPKPCAGREQTAQGDSGARIVDHAACLAQEISRQISQILAQKADDLPHPEEPAGVSAVAAEAGAAAAVVGPAAEVPGGAGPQPFLSTATAATGAVARSQKAAAMSSRSISRRTPRAA